jgi:hypothetical protein
MDSSMNVISTKKADVSLTSDGHILIRILEYSEVEAEDIKEINAAKDQLTEGKRNTVIFVTPNYGSISKEARELSASKEVYHNAIAKALVVSNMAGRLVSHFFITVNKPPAPTKIFKTEAEAAKWLTKMRAQDK